MVEKCIGEAYDKVKSAGEGEGITGYLIMHEWFTKTTDFGKTTLMQSLQESNIDCRKLQNNVISTIAN